MFVKVKKITDQQLQDLVTPNGVHFEKFFEDDDVIFTFTDAFEATEDYQEWPRPDRHIDRLNLILNQPKLERIDWEMDGENYIERL